MNTSEPSVEAGKEHDEAVATAIKPVRLLGRISLTTILAITGWGTAIMLCCMTTMMVVLYTSGWLVLPNQTGRSGIAPEQTSIPDKTSTLVKPSRAQATPSTAPTNSQGSIEDMVLIEAGNFYMGTSGPVTSNEAPQHSVYLKSFLIDRTEVTNGQYAQCVADGGCVDPRENGTVTRSRYYKNSEYKDYPVVHVSWEDANTYCNWAGKRLPTEAEWEKAARGPEGFLYPWGDDAPNCTQKANYYRSASPEGSKYGENCEADTNQVGSYPKGQSPYGVLDMAGNVMEWVNDYYDEKYYQTSTEPNPLGPVKTEERVIRGGVYSYTLHSAYRNSDVPEHHESWLGFRCAADVQE